MSFEKNVCYKENANLKWGALAKIILNNNSQNCKDLIRSVAGDIYAKLRELANRIQKPKFRKILAYVDDILKEEMAETIEEKFSDKEQNEDEKKLRSLITLLFMIKKGKLEEVIASKKFNRRERMKSLDRDSKRRRTSFLHSNRNIDKYNKFSRYLPSIHKTNETNDFKSVKVVPPYPLLNKTGLGWFPNKEVIELSSKHAEEKQKQTLNDETSSHISIDSFANEELDWACAQIGKFNTPQSTRTKSVPIVKIHPPTSKVSNFRKGSEDTTQTTPKDESLNKSKSKKFIAMRDVRTDPHWWKVKHYV